MPLRRKKRLGRAIAAVAGTGEGATDGTLSAAQTAYSAEWLNTLVTEHGRNYASNTGGGRPFQNAESIIVGPDGGDDDLLIDGAEYGDKTAMPAVAVIQLDVAGHGDGTMESNGSTSGAKITITSTDGTAVEYYPFTATTAADREFKANGTDANASAGLVACVNNAAGHNGKILAVDEGSGWVSLIQNVHGTAGNKAITENISGCDVITNDQFVDGADPLRAALPHYWMDTTNSKTTVVAAMAEGVAITASEGILYDPSGPKSRYIPQFEKVSAGSARYVCIVPEGTWDANDVWSFEIHGHTPGDPTEAPWSSAPADKLTIQGVEIDGTATAINAHGDYNLDGTVTNAAFTNITGTINHNGGPAYSSARTGGFVVKWERDYVADEDATYKGWMLYWKHIPG